MSQNNQPHYTATERRYTPQELATLWQCSTDVIYDLLRQGRLKGFKIGASWRINESAVRAYEENPDNQTATVYRPRTRTTTPTVLRVV